MWVSSLSCEEAESMNGKKKNKHHVITFFSMAASSCISFKRLVH